MSKAGTTWTADDVRALAKSPTASAEMRRLNPALFGVDPLKPLASEKIGMAVRQPLKPKTQPQALPAPVSSGLQPLYITIKGQIRGGKNNMGVTKTGRHYPNPAWAKWRDDAVRQIVDQVPPGRMPFAIPTSVKLVYVAGDRIHRDMPAIIDAIWHCLERAGVVTNDSLLWITESTRSYEKANPRAEMTLTFTQ